MIEAARLVAVFDHPELDVSLEIVGALVEGGITAVEFTARRNNAGDILDRFVPAVHDAWPQVCCGIGSISDRPLAQRSIDAGADFIVSPGFVGDVMDACAESSVLNIAGCATVTEMLNAASRGSHIVKAFPAAQLGGPAFVKSVLAPCPGLRIMPTGGITTDVDEMQEWFDAGAVAVGVGSALVDAEVVTNKDWEQLTARASRTLAAAATP